MQYLYDADTDGLCVSEESRMAAMGAYTETEDFANLASTATAAMREEMAVMRRLMPR